MKARSRTRGNLRIDLRGSACDDPRIKATLYDFDANEMLQSITYVWERPPGPAPAPIFQERVTDADALPSRCRRRSRRVACRPTPRWGA